MRCEQAETGLSEFLDDELTGDERAPLEAHLVACAPCRRKHRMLMAARDAFRELDPDRVPDGFEHRLRRRYGTAPTIQTRSGAIRRPWLPALGLAAAAAIGALALGLFSPAEEPADRALASPASAGENGRELGLHERLAEPTCGSPTSAGCEPVMPCSNAVLCGPFGTIDIALLGS